MSNIAHKNGTLTVTVWFPYIGSLEISRNYAIFSPFYLDSRHNFLK